MAAPGPLVASVHALQDSVRATLDSLTGSASSSINAMQIAREVVTETMRASLKLRTVLLDGGRVVLHVTNQSPFPFSDVCVDVSLRGIRGAPDPAMRASEHTGAVALSEAPDSAACAQRVLSGGMLAACTATRLPLSIHLSPARQCNVRISLSACAPGDSTPVETSHECGLYLLHQSSCCLLRAVPADWPVGPTDADAAGELDPACASHVWAAWLREFFLVPPMQALPLGGAADGPALAVLQPAENGGCLLVLGPVSREGLHVDVHVVARGVSQTLARTLAAELVALAGAAERAAAAQL